MGLDVVLLSFGPHVPVPLLFGLALGAGIVLGLVNAVLVVVLRINSVIATIATLGVFLGVGEMLRPIPGGLISPSLSSAARHSVGHVPVLFIVVTVLALLADAGINMTRVGLRARAVGYSAQRAVQVGVRSPLYRAGMYVIAGLVAGLGAVALAAQTGVGDPTVGSSYTLLSIAVPVLGGAMLAGGRASALGCVLGALFVAEIEDLIPFINLPNGGYPIAVGALTVVALIVGTGRNGTALRKLAELVAKRSRTSDGAP
jgi:ribose/xylose/arabinose/galactoside ABC-type transport system permease subunit